MKHIEKILSGLQLNGKKELYKGKRWKKLFSKKAFESIIDSYGLYAVFAIESKPTVLFFDNPESNCIETLSKWIWNYNQAFAAVIVTDENTIIFNAYSIDGASKLLKELDNGQALARRFNYLELITGRTIEYYSRRLNPKERVDFKLLENMRAARDEFMAKLLAEPTLLTLSKRNQEPVKITATRIANALLGRMLFLRYLIDRKVFIKFYDGKTVYKSITNDILTKEILPNSKKTFQLFQHLKDEFGEELFPFKIDEESVVKNVIGKDRSYLGVLVSLLNGDVIATGQRSMFPLYDFSVIPIEFVSNIYEQFIGESRKKDKKENVEVDRTKQEKLSAYYTPLFLVDHILSETVEKHLHYDTSCIVLDPACGSGIFLVETLRKIIEKNLKISRTITPAQWREELCRLVKENIYGIDVDRNAVHVAVFSLYITLLDYQEPADIVKFKFPSLIDSNFFIADFFDLNHSFNEILKRVKLDYIIGNPPWGKVEESVELYESYWRKRQQEETQKQRLLSGNSKDKISIAASGKEIAQIFLIRVSDFAKGKTVIQLIVISKILYNIQALTFRKYFFNNFHIQKIFELAPQRREIFNSSSDKAIAPAVIIRYQCAFGAETGNNTIEHWTLMPNIFFKKLRILVIENYDRKKILQQRVKEHDWILKVLVYGNYLDIQFILMLKDHYSSLDKFLPADKFLIKQGFKYTDGENIYTTKQHKGKPFIIDSDKELKQFELTPRGIWDGSEVGFLPENETFEGPALLFRKRTSQDLKAVCALSYGDVIFTCTITAIKAYERKNLKLLKNIAGFLVSDFFSYSMLHLGASVGIEREDIYVDEFLRILPFTEKIVVQDSVEKIEQLNKDLQMENANSFSDTDLNLFSRDSHKAKILNGIKAAHLKLNQDILATMSLSDVEGYLLHYAINVSIPTIKNGRSSALNQLSFNDAILDGYAKIFYEYFSSKFTKPISIFIYFSELLIGIECKAMTRKGEEVKWIRKNAFDEFTKLSFSEASKDLFIQKNVRGYGNNSFYIIKPNEYKCWHPAIAYLDAYEINEAIQNRKNQTLHGESQH